MKEQEPGGEIRTRSKVILIGWDPGVVDYSKWPGLTREKLASALERDRQMLCKNGFEASLLFIDNADTAYVTVKDHLASAAPDIVLIGADVRTDPEHFIVFEQRVNAVLQSTPNARICFNTNPSDTAEAVKRWA